MSMNTKFMAALLSAAALSVATTGAVQAQSATSEEAIHTPQKCDLNLTLDQVAALKAPKANKRYKIAYSMVSMAGYFYQATAYGAMKAAEEAGVDLTLNASQGFATQAQQITNVRNVLSRDIDGLIINPVDVNGTVAAVEAAAEKKVPVVTIGTLVNSDKADRIVQDDYAQGAAAADFIASKLPSGGKGIIMGGPANATWALRRVAGFQDALKKRPDIKIAAVTNENVDPADGLQKFTNAARTAGNVDFVYVVFNLILPPNSVPPRYSKTVYVAGSYDELTVDALKAGTAAGVLPDFPISEGYLGVAYMVRKLNGETLPPITCLPNALITNADTGSDVLNSQTLFPKGWKPN